MHCAGAVLETGLIFPTGRKANKQKAEKELVSLVKKHRYMIQVMKPTFHS